MSVPNFAVVGHPNKGKSSIVATLARDDTVFIDPVSGSTTRSAHYPMSIDSTVLYELIDTPGFQRARAVLAWLKDHCSDASKRASTVKHFIAEHQENSKFTSEIELLTPLAEGAGIIYVVDGSRPYGQEYEAEMEILRWTGCPSMALINPIDNEDYVAEWESALGQYFRTVRIFNANKAEFNKQIELLSVFGLLAAEWQEPLNKAVNILKTERQQQHEAAAESITSLLVDTIQYQKSQNIPDGIPIEPAKTLLIKQYMHKITGLEQATRKTIEQIFSHEKIKKSEAELEFETTNLFDLERWYLFGLSKKQLTTTAVGAGASAGALIDLGLGGSSLFLGAITGGVVAAAGVFQFSDKIAAISIKGIPTGGQKLQCGPARHQNFPFVILGRALLHYQFISQRSHADRSILQLGDSHPLEKLPAKSKSKLMKIFNDTRKNKNILQQREALYDILLTKIIEMG